MKRYTSIITVLILLAIISLVLIGASQNSSGEIDLPKHKDQPVRAYDDLIWENVK